MIDAKNVSIDKTLDTLIEKAANEKIETIWDRKKIMKTPCTFGEKGVCCQICSMGPCRVSFTPDKGVQRGICGATAATIVARNQARKVAAGTASHSDHARDIAYVMHMASENGDYTIKDRQKLFKLATEWNVETKDKDVYTVAHEVAEIALNEFGKPFGYLRFLDRAPEPRKELWEKLELLPRAIDREVTTIMHSTHIGCMSDALSLIHMSMRASLADGWGGSMIATVLSDILFGTPTPIKTETNLGVLDEKKVNIVLHGHEPSLSEMIVLAVCDEGLIELAKQVGADGINLVGMCCTANEVTMRHGIKIAGNFHQQEMIIVTGVVEAMIVDVQCILPSLSQISKCYHTKFITTSPKAKITGSTYIDFDKKNALAIAKKLVREAVENFKNRKPEKVFVPKERSDAIVGFTVEGIKTHLAKVAGIDAVDGSLKPLVDSIANGSIRGIAAIVGCNNTKNKHDSGHNEVIRNLTANNVLVVATGCAAQAAAKGRLMTAEAKDIAGDGLKAVCDFVGIPPVLHLGSCVDISRILVFVSEVAKYLGVDNSALPVVGVAPEWMSEKALAIGTYVVTSGVDVFLGLMPPIGGSPEVVDILTNAAEDLVGAKFYVYEDFSEMTEAILDRMDEKRRKLGI